MKLDTQLWGLFVGFFHVVLVSCLGDDDLKHVLLPEILDTETDVTFNKGKTAVLDCEVKNQGTKTVIWRRVEEPSPLTVGTFPYTTDKRISTTHNKYKNIWSLRIKHIQLSDAGEFECQVSSKHHIVKHFKLTVTDIEEEEEPLPKVVITGRKYVEIGQPIELTCNATGEDQPPMDLDWFKDGDKVNSVAGSKTDITKYKNLEQKTIVSRLFIQKARKKDKGDYVCRIGDEDEEVATVEIHVLNAATNNVKRGTEKDTDGKSNAAKKSDEGKEVKVEYETKGQGGRASASMVTINKPLIHLTAWTSLLVYLFRHRYNLEAVGFTEID